MGRVCDRTTSSARRPGKRGSGRHTEEPSSICSFCIGASATDSRSSSTRRRHRPSPCEPRSATWIEHLWVVFRGRPVIPSITRSQSSPRRGSAPAAGNLKAGASVAATPSVPGDHFADLLFAHSNIAENDARLAVFSSAEPSPCEERWMSIQVPACSQCARMCRRFHAILIADVIQRADVRMCEWELARASRSKRARTSLVVVSPDRRILTAPASFRREGSRERR